MDPNAKPEIVLSLWDLIQIFDAVLNVYHSDYNTDILHGCK